MKRKVCAMIAGVVLFLGFCALAGRGYAQTSEIRIFTYLPAPHGVFRLLKIIPGTPPFTCDATTRGSVYFDDAQSAPFFCNGSKWQLLGPGMLDFSHTYTPAAVAHDGIEMRCGADQVLVAVHGWVQRYNPAAEKENLNLLPKCTSNGEGCIFAMEGKVPGDAEVEAWLTCLQK